MSGLDNLVLGRRLNGSSRNSRQIISVRVIGEMSTWHLPQGREVVQFAATRPQGVDRVQQFCQVSPELDWVQTREVEAVWVIFPSLLLVAGEFGFADRA